jgi:hypothetical protein|tara:strand:- start:727 stop:1371 length:645 start_codon:yes stop_codon:yes gene_type:complete
MSSYILSLVILTSSALVTNVGLTGFVKPIKKVVNQGVTYEELHDEALFNCPFSKPSAEREAIINTLINVEKKFNLPPSLRGMLLSAACHESGFNPDARGDHKFSKNKKAMAIGLFQMWPWWEKHYKIDRADPIQAASAYLSHVKSKLNKVKNMCRLRTPERTWVVAWVTAIRAPKDGGRCKEKPKFYRILKRWHTSIKLAREVREGCEDQVCGC